MPVFFSVRLRIMWRIRVESVSRWSNLCRIIIKNIQIDIKRHVIYNTIYKQLMHMEVKE